MRASCSVGLVLLAASSATTAARPDAELGVPIEGTLAEAQDSAVDDAGEPCALGRDAAGRKSGGAEVRSRRRSVRLCARTRSNRGDGLRSDRRLRGRLDRGFRELRSPSRR
ncbi:MAG: hypothetical protein D6718_08685 [Acidobacteria bacterium]|nr:MAG: hypothetical protein D6718_08685 [Acidobacteriota bacterium]